MILVTISCAHSEVSPCQQLLVKTATADELPDTIAAKVVAAG